MLKVYHNPICSKSIRVLNILQEKNIPFEIINFVEMPLSKDALSNLLQKLEMKAKDIIRMSEVKENKDFSDDEWFNFLLKNQNLMQRPIIEIGNRAIIGRPIESINTLLDNYN